MDVAQDQSAVTKEEAERSHRQAAFAREIGNFSPRYREGEIVAITETARRVGVQILIAALATAAGFLAFVPTEFSGVAELGLIAGAGMIMAFICTLGFLPAHMEALVDLRNLLAQGYVPVMGQDGQTVYLVQAARSIRGGVTITF